jgi:hypothetical protein
VVCAADGAEAGAAVVCAADGSDGGRAAEEREERLELAIVGQELVPVSDRRVSSLEEESLEKETNPERFQTPGAQKMLGTPDQLQSNVMSLKTNEDSDGQERQQVPGPPLRPKLCSSFSRSSKVCRACRSRS